MDFDDDLDFSLEGEGEASSFPAEEDIPSPDDAKQLMLGILNYQFNGQNLFIPFDNAKYTLGNGSEELFVWECTSFLPGYRCFGATRQQAFEVLCKLFSESFISGAFLNHKINVVSKGDGYSATCESALPLVVKRGPSVEEAYNEYLLNNHSIRFSKKE